MELLNEKYLVSSLSQLDLERPFAYLERPFAYLRKVQQKLV